MGVVISKKKKRRLRKTNLVGAGFVAACFSDGTGDNAGVDTAAASRNYISINPTLRPESNLTRIQRILDICAFPIRLALSEDSTRYPSGFTPIIILASIVLLNQRRFREISDAERCGTRCGRGGEECLPLVEGEVVEVFKVFDVVGEVGDDVVEFRGVTFPVGWVGRVVVCGGWGWVASAGGGLGWFGRLRGLGRAGFIFLDAFAVAFLLFLGAIWKRRCFRVFDGLRLQ